jgi:hypothetical protein
MSRKFPLCFCTLLLAFTSITCAPSDEAGRPSSIGSENGHEDIKPPTPLTDVPKHLKDRIDAALQNVRKRTLLKTNSFWTIFHGILGMGLDHAVLFDTETGESVNAIDYICKGGKVRGLEFKETDDGVDVVTMAGSGVGQGHQDQFIAEMAQWGMRKDRKIVVNGKEHNFADFIRYSKQRTSVTRDQELSWAILIISQYYRTDLRWTNLYKEDLAFEDVVRYELNQPIVECPVCGGTHRLFGLTWAYHLHVQRGGKKEGVWLDVEKRIDEFKKLARRFRNKGDGSFSTDYFRGPGNARDTQLRLATTGHILEWLALALSDSELREPWIQDAAGALCVMILENRFKGLDGGAMYHAAHGLGIYRARLFGTTEGHGPLIPPPPKS